MPHRKLRKLRKAALPFIPGANKHRVFEYGNILHFKCECENKILVIDACFVGSRNLLSSIYDPDRKASYGDPSGIYCCSEARSGYPTYNTCDLYYINSPNISDYKLMVCSECINKHPNAQKSDE